MKLAKNMLAAIGLMALLVIALNTVSAVAGVIGDAFDRSQAGHDAKIAIHKLDNPASEDSNYVTDPMNGYDEEIALLEQAEKEAAEAYANAYLAKADGD